MLSGWTALALFPRCLGRIYRQVDLCGRHSGREVWSELTLTSKDVSIRDKGARITVLSRITRRDGFDQGVKRLNNFLGKLSRQTSTIPGDHRSKLTIISSVVNPAAEERHLTSS